MRQLGEARDDAMWKCFGAQLSGNICLYLGKLGDVRAYLENALSLWDPAYRDFAPTAEDPYVGAIFHLSRTLLCLGHLGEAVSRRDEALAATQPLSPFMRVFALRQSWYGDWAIEGAESARTMLASANEVVTLSNEHGFRDPLGIGNIMRGWCLCALGQEAEGIPLLLQGLTTCRTGGRSLMIPFFLTVLADAYGMAAQPREGLDRLAEAAKLVDTTHERWADAEIHRLQGKLLLSMHEQTAAESSYRRALEVAQQRLGAARGPRPRAALAGPGQVHRSARAALATFRAGSPKASTRET